MWVFPWCPNLSWACTRTVYFHDLGMTRARNFWPKSVMCLYSSPLVWVKKSVSCWGAFPLDKHLEICLQKGPVFCIWRRASNLSAVRDLGVVCGTGETSGIILGCTVDISSLGCFKFGILYGKQVHPDWRLIACWPVLKLLEIVLQAVRDNQLLCF